MTAIADLTHGDRRRLLEHLDQADELDRLIRERGTLASPAEPEPLHRTRHDTAERTPTVGGAEAPPARRRPGPRPKARSPRRGTSKSTPGATSARPTLRTVPYLGLRPCRRVRAKRDQLRLVLSRPPQAATVLHVDDYVRA